MITIKTQKLNLYKNFLTTIALTIFLLPNLAMAAGVCDIINNQYQSMPLIDYSSCIEAGNDVKPPTPKNAPKNFEKRSLREICADKIRNAALEANNKKKADGATAAADGFLYIINEEPLGGTTTDSFSTICARETKCSYGQYSTAAKLRKCVTTYTTLAACKGSTKKEIEDATIIKYDKPGETETLNLNPDYTYCEDVQVFRATAGTDLLYRYVGLIYRYMAMLGGVLAVLMMIIAGTMMAAAGDNADQVNKAKGMINKCISGLILLFLSAIILYTINPNFFTI